MLDYRVDTDQIQFFLDYLELDTSQQKAITDANQSLEKIKNGWNKIEEEIFSLCELFFKPLKNPLTITVYVFPEYFYLGASESSKKIILFGQPPRTALFPQAIVLHEISHILLSRVSFSRPPIVDEIVCCLFEDYIYQTFESKTFSNIWSGYSLDNFHQAAHDFMKNNPDITIKKEEDFHQLISHITGRLDQNLKNLKAKKGLLSQLETEINRKTQ